MSQLPDAKADASNKSYQFRYVRSLTGELSGPQMIVQTELAISDVGENAFLAVQQSNQAVDTSNRAEQISQAAEDVANHALQVAQAASGEAGDIADQLVAVKKTAEQADANATTALNTANTALTTAQAAQTTADSADTKADSALATAEQADLTANAASETATEAQTTANGLAAQIQALADSIGKAGRYVVNSETGVNLNALTDVVTYYFTGSATPLPSGITTPFWFMTWVNSTGDRIRQFIYKESRMFVRDSSGGLVINSGTQAFPIAFAGTTLATLTAKVTSGNFTVETNTGTLQGSSASSTSYSGGLLLEYTAAGNGNVTIGGKTIGTITNNTFTLAADPVVTTSNAKLTVISGQYFPGTLSLSFSVDWLNVGYPSYGAWLPLGGGIVDTGNTITLTGDVTGKGTFDASGNMSFATDTQNFSMQSKYQSVSGAIPDTFSAENYLFNVSGNSYTIKTGSPNFLNWSISTDAGISAFTALSGASKLVTLCIYNDSLEGNLTITWPSDLKWVGATNSAPVWGANYGGILIVNLWYIEVGPNNVKLASVVYNSEA